MKTQKSTPVDPDLINAEKALRRAAIRALEIGKQTGTPVYVIENGEIVDLNRDRHGPSRRKFVVCIRNQGYGVSLERRKLYEVLPDSDAERHAQLRIVDESGEDCLYPSGLFAAVELPFATEQAVVEAG